MGAEMNVESNGVIKLFQDVERGRLFWRDSLYMRVSLGADGGVLQLSDEPRATIVTGANLVNQSVLLLNESTFQVAPDLRCWRFGLPSGPATGIVIVSCDGLRLRAYHPSGEVDIDLANGVGKRITADANVAWTDAWRIVVKAGTEQETPLLQSSRWPLKAITTAAAQQ
ncbi:MULTISPECIES: hypothetical protein [unclassified Bradyrhizobium]|uniref:hypothetical protein n=1 Tax=unclassified Bradyrhizobium TaxID=2631580 RepID=UPI0029169530|nr:MULTISPECIES: hypothetical protein [unclassified Bradyrhizobium]